MEQMPQIAGYDRAITVFSPNGRLYQVEYAREAVKKGTVSVGIKYKNGVVLAVDKNVTDPLMVAESIEKIYQIDEHIGIATSGLVADGRRLVDKGRVDAQSHRLTFGEQMGIGSMVKKMTDHMQLYTQIGGLRPFGVALLLAGVNGKGDIRLFETDPSGSYWEYAATAIGERSQEVREIFKKEYSEDLDKSAAIALALKAMYKGTEDQFNGESVEISIIEKKGYKKFSDEEVAVEIEKMLKSAKKKKK